MQLRDKIFLNSPMPNEIYTFNYQRENLKSFLEVYELQSIVIPPACPVKGLKSKKDRICRFCTSTDETVSFRKDAHIIPHMLGNKYLISDFECDNCNELFSKYENDFANWLGISRSILGTKGKKGKPKYKSPDGINSDPNFLGKTQEAFSVLLNSENSFLNFDPKTFKSTINYKKEPYVPFNVYKAVLKIALSILSETEIEEYIHIIKNINNSKKENILTPFSQGIHCSTIPITENKESLVCYLFKRNESKENVPFQLFTIHYENIFISIPIPLHRGDLRNAIYSDPEFHFRFPPPIYLFQLNQDQPIQTTIIDLSSKEINRNDFGHVEFQTPTLFTTDLISFDTKTGKSGKADFKPEEIRGVLIVNGTKTFTMEEIKELASKLKKDRID